VGRLQSFGVDVTLEEVEAIGHSIAGRPHFARLLVQKGYVRSTDEAFRLYLDETAKAYVAREEPYTAAAIQRVLAAGGLPSIAHPVRLNRNHEAEERIIRQLCDAGLPAIEVWHSDHEPADVARYLDAARRFGLIATGGSDFHGENKPAIRLGTGIRGNVLVEREVLERMRRSEPATLPR
jgi:predicted metal-dependent phosphoesterase TrpH